VSGTNSIMNPQIAQTAADSKDKQTHAIIGAAMEVHRHLGPGFLEAVYQQAPAIEFSARGVPFASEVDLPVYYKGERLPCSYRADFVCYNDVNRRIEGIESDYKYRRRPTLELSQGNTSRARTSGEFRSAKP
jgi:hypothetical protein